MDRPAWIAFDLNGTLLDPGAVLGPERVEQGRAALDDAVVQAMADTLTGEHRPFPDYLRAGLERRLGGPGASGAELDAAMERARALPAFPDAEEALGTLAAAGYRIAVVTNSAAGAARTAIEAAGIGAHLEIVVGADEVGAYKPDPRIYAHAARRLGAPPDAICLVAAHAWDVLGAMRAGWRGAWVGHREQHLLATVPEPAVQAATLAEAARLLAAL